MKDRIGIAIVIANILISCLISSGCVRPREYIIINSGSTLMQPTFCMYRDIYSPERADIESITIYKAGRSSENKKLWELDSLWEWQNIQTVWDLEYKSPDTFIKRLLTSPVCCLTYGEVPPGYQEEAKAGPLEPEQLYIVHILSAKRSLSEGLDFIIRLDGNGIPDRIEYHDTNFLITNLDYVTKPRDGLRRY